MENSNDSNNLAGEISSELGKNQNRLVEPALENLTDHCSVERRTASLCLAPQIHQECFSNPLGAREGPNGFGVTHSPKVLSTEELLSRAITKGTQLSIASATVNVLPASATNMPFQMQLPMKRKISLEQSEDLFKTEGKPIVSGESLDAFKLPQTGGYYDRMSLHRCSTEVAAHAYNALQGSLSIGSFASSKLTADVISLKEENEAVKMKLKATEDLQYRTVAELEAREKALEEKMLDQAAFYTLRSRVELMEEFQRGEHSKGDLAKEQAMLAQVSPPEAAPGNRSAATTSRVVVLALPAPNAK